MRPARLPTRQTRPKTSRNPQSRSLYEVDAFRALGELAIEPLLRDKAADDDVRVWVPGCGSGDEAYLLAMLVLDRLQASAKGSRLRLFATDVDPDALELARGGRVPASIAAHVPASYLQRYLTKTRDGDAYEVADSVRNCVIFAIQDLAGHPPFARLDLILSRALGAHRDPVLREKIVSLFHFGLKDGGCLFLEGGSPRGPSPLLFQALSAKWPIYRRTAARVPRVPPPRRAASWVSLAQGILLRHHAPAAVLVNRSFEILHHSGPTERFLTSRCGAPTQNLLTLANREIQAKLYTAVCDALRDGDVAAVVDVAANGESAGARILVHPVQEPSSLEPLALLVFEEVNRSPAVPPAPNQETTIDDLRISNEELSTANEEMAAMNEELRTANEELEVSKEELQSLNEELSIVNSEVQYNLRELEATTNDLNNLLASTQIATVFLDVDFRIKRYTPTVAPLMNLIPSDVGRPFRDVARRFADDALLGDVEAVLDDLAPREREVESEQGGRWYIRRVLPYRSQNGNVEGTVLTFTDITELKLLNSELEQRSRWMKLLHDVAAISNKAESVEDALHQAIVHVCEELGCFAGNVLLPVEERPLVLANANIWWSREPGRFERFLNGTRHIRFGSGPGLIGQVIATGKPAWTSDLRDASAFSQRARPLRETGVRTLMASPLLVSRRVVGVLEFLIAGEPRRVEQSTLDLLSQIGTQLGRVAERRELERRVADMVDEEQRSLGRELHDTIGQQVTGLGMLARTLHQRLEKDGSPEGVRAASLVQSIEETKRQVRALSKGMLPVELDPRGLVSALEDLAARTRETYGVDCRVLSNGGLAVKDAFTATHLYCIAQEAVHNAIKHGDGGDVSIGLHQDGSLILEVENRGGAFTARDDSNGMGLRIMRYRARLIGAKLRVESAPAGGVLLTCRMGEETHG